MRAKTDEVVPRRSGHPAHRRNLLLLSVSFRYRMQDVFANGVETIFDIVIRIPKDRNAELLHRLVPDGIVRLSLVGIMLASVQFDDQASGGDVKIGNVPEDDLLPLDGDGEILQEIVPEMLFLRRHIPAELLREGLGFFLIPVAVVTHRVLPDE